VARGFSDAERAGRRRLITAAVAGAAGVAAFADLLPGQSSPKAQAAAGGGPTDWLNVVDQYGADPAGAKDSTAAIQAAIAACPPGGVVYVPAGKYAVSAPLLISGAGVRLQGSHSVNAGFESAGINAAIIDAASGFTGAAMIDDGGQPDFSIRDLAIHGSALPAGTTAGIRLTGGTSGSGPVLENVVVGVTPGSGIVVNGGTVVMRQVGVFRAGYSTGTGSGFDVTTADSWFTNCLSAGHATHGWAIKKATSTTFTACRAEDGTGSAGAGFKLTMTGTWGGTSFTQCTTDRNSGDGFVVSGVTGNGCIQLNGCEFRRDGYNNAAGGGYSGIKVVNSVLPVVIDGSTVTARQGDQSTGADSPYYGLTVASSAFVSVNGGYIACAAGGRPVNWDGKGKLLVAPGLLTATVATSAQTLNLPAPSQPDPSAQDQGLRGWAYDPVLQTASAVPAAGVLYLVKVPVYTAGPVASILVEVVTPGSGLAAGRNFAGLYSAGGVLIAQTADQSLAWTSPGLHAMTLAGSGSHYVQQGWAYVALLANGPARPAFGRASAQGPSAVNAGLPASAARFATNAAGQATLPASIAMASNALSTTAFWAALA
jgi:pectate lyase-like protein